MRTRISYEERVLIERLWLKRWGVRAIARELSRSPSTICREVRRNLSVVKQGFYRAAEAHYQSDERKRLPRRRKGLKCDFTRDYAEAKLKLRWSPQIISGRLSLEYPEYKISTEAIYQWIYRERRDLIEYLVQGTSIKLRKRKQRKRAKIVHIVPKIPIERRSKAANQRSEFGHWEIDLMMGKQSGGALLVAIERKSRFTKLAKVSTKKALLIAQTMVKEFQSVPKHLKKSFTYDNGTENAQHELVNKVLATKSFFCNPYHSWEKGAVGNVIGALRTFFPKSINFKPISEKEINNAQWLINSRPRVCLNFLTPYKIIAGVALAA